MALELPEDFLTLRKALSVTTPLKKVADRLEWLRTEMPITNTKGVDADGAAYSDGDYAVHVEGGVLTLRPFSAGAVPIAQQPFTIYTVTFALVDGLAPVSESPVVSTI